MRFGVPEVNLFVLGAGDKLLHGEMDVQTPQLICVALKRRLLMIKKFVSTSQQKQNDVFSLHQNRVCLCEYLHNGS